MIERTEKRLGRLITGILLLPLMLTGISTVSADEEPLMVEAWRGENRSGRRYETRVVGRLEGFRPVQDVKLSRFGGWVDGSPEKATGFFHTKKIGDRWWLIDPDGHRFLHMAVNSVSIQRGPQFKEAFRKKYTDDLDWAEQTLAMLADRGFNGTGSWTDDELLKQAPRRPIYTPKISMLSEFGRRLKIAEMMPGHWGYPHSLAPIFHPEFEAFCNERAKAIVDLREDPYLLGYFSDNEIQLPRDALDRHLKFAPDEPAYTHYAHQVKVATDWFRRRHGGRLDLDTITDDDRQAWVGHTIERYYTIVGRAIRRVDPNHMYLGSRLYGSEKSNPAVWQAAGKHLDAIAVNIYGVWTPTEQVRRWGEWSGKPLIATEWYAKGQDSGMKNISGAGWTVATQQDRGRFYQNFTLGLLESRVCVGWHWFKYADNDPMDTGSDPSNRNSNKGMLNFRYEPYTPLLDAMRALNTQAYPLTEHFGQ